MSALRTAFRLLFSPLRGRPGMSNVERFAAAAVKLLTIGAGASLALIGLYFYKFAQGDSLFALSDSQQNWNNFGTFVGGSLGPLFGFLAFIAVLFTVVQQAAMIDAADRRSNLDEIQRLLSSISARIDGQFLASPRLESTHAFKVGSPQALFDLLATVGQIAAWRGTKKEGWSRFQIDDEELRELKESTQRELQQVRIDVNSLSWCLLRYTEKGGSDDVRAFYVNRYVVSVAWLHAMGSILSEESNLVFHPAKTIEVFRTEGLK